MSTPPQQKTGRILPFRPRAHSRRDKPMREQTRSPVPDLSKYSRLPEEEDYAHRMLMNVLALLFLSVMVYCGIWIADNMSQRSKDQDCVLAGRTNCALIPLPPD